jgi:predicted RNA-binding Zn-ribbon protein involved in translation (DUF1610 family)
MNRSRKPRPRTVQRQLERERRKLTESQLKLAAVSDGGAMTRPIAVESSSVIESRAASFPCLGCGRGTRVLAHEAAEADGHRARVVKVGCPQCGTERTLYFRIAGSPLN